MKTNHLNLFLFMVALTSFPDTLVIGQPTQKDSVIKLFYEKVYVHTDRDYYTQGEDIWFKAYLTDAQTNEPVNISKSLYVELISPEQKIMKREVIRMDSAVGKGDFHLPDTLIDGVYQLRAYTNWMLNFKDQFIFEKDLHISGIKDSGPFRGIKPDKKMEIRFFPESGSMIANVANVVAFKAEDANGNGIDAKGWILDASGDTITSFQTSVNGMGSFSLFPLAETNYKAVGNFKNRSLFNVNLPAILKKGFAIHFLKEDTAFVSLSINLNVETLDEWKGKSLILSGKTAGLTFFKQEIKISKTTVLVRVPVSLFPGGIAVFTLYDSHQIPQCERLFFVDHPEKERAMIGLSKESSGKETNLKLKVTQDGLPVNANLSLSVVDAGFVPAESGNIRTYLMLESEIRGKIDNINSYFDPSNPNRQNQMNLLLLTQGWRDYNWRGHLGESITHIPEQGITVSGRVRKLFADQPLKEIKITLLVRGKKKFETWITRTDTSGKFYFDGLKFYGNNNLMLNSEDQKNKNKGLIVPDSLFDNVYPVSMRSIVLPDSGHLEVFTSEALRRKTILDRYTLKDTIPLNEVVVSAVKQKKEIQDQWHLANAKTFPEYDLKPDPSDNFENLGFYFENKLNFTGLVNFTQSKPDILFRIRGGIPSYGSLVYERPRYFVNKFEAAGDEVNEILMEDVERIIISFNDNEIPKELYTIDGETIDNQLPNRKYSGNYMVSIYTRSSKGKTDFSMANNNVYGYYEARDFYVPQKDEIKPDLRTTIHWEPMITTDEDGEAVVKMANPDPKTKVRISIQGITSTGEPVSFISDEMMR